MSALVMVLVLGASDVSLRVDAGTPCLEQRRLASLLVAQGLVVRAGAPLEVHARGTGTGLSLVGSRGAEHFSRTVPAGVGECAAVERVVVSLINSWAQPLSLALRGEAKADAGAVRAVVDLGDAGQQTERVAAGAPTRDAGEPMDRVAAAARDGGELAQRNAGARALSVVAATVDGSELAVVRDAGVRSFRLVATTVDAGELALVRDAGAQALSVVATTVDAGELAVLTTRNAGARALSVVAATVDGSELAVVRDGGVRASSVVATAIDAGELALGLLTRDAGARASSVVPTTVDAGELAVVRDAGVRALSVVATTVDAGELAVARNAGGRASSGVATTVDTGKLAVGLPTTRGDASELALEVPTIRDAGAVTSREAAGLTMRGGEPLDATTRDAGVLAEGEPPSDGGFAAASPLVIDVSLLGGAALGPTETVAGTGSVRVGFSLSRFGAVLDGNLETERTKSDSVGTAFATRQWLGLSARAEFLPLERLLLDVTLGVRGTRVIVGGRNYPGARTEELFDFGGTLGAGARVRLFGPVWLELRGTAGLRRRLFALVLEDSATMALTRLLVVQPWDIGLSLGLCARF